MYGFGSLGLLIPVSWYACTDDRMSVEATAAAQSMDFVEGGDSEMHGLGFRG